MSRDALAQLLRKADATAAPATVVSELAAQVRGRHSRRRMVQSVGVAAGVIAAVPLLLLLVTMSHTSPPPPQQPPAIAITPPRVPTRADLVRLDLQADMHEQVAAQLLQAAGPTSHVLPAPAADDDNTFLAHVREQRDRAALILIYEADQAARQKQTNRAIATYRRTIELFPKTYAAAVAQQRLKEMPT